MYKTLFLLCPTDCLESIIHHRFKHESYFFTSLGNSFVSDIETLDSIKELVQEHTIKKIYFVLSNDNQIILDALGGQFFSEVRGLRSFYCKINKQKRHSELFCSKDNLSYSIVSYFLNNKIKELQLELSNLTEYPISVSGKIYNRHENTFEDIYSNLVCVEKHILN